MMHSRTGWRGFWCLGALLVSASAARPGALLEENMEFGGQVRQWLVNLPPSYSGAEAVPLVVFLHGAGGSYQRVLDGSKDTGWITQSDAAGFIVVFPNGGTYYEPSDGWQWNTFEFPVTEPDDVGFLYALIQILRDRYGIDPTRTYMTGHSNGASMTNTFAFYHADVLAAIAPAKGAWSTTFGIDAYSVTPQPSVPLPVWIWRGELETFQTGQETRDVQDQNQKQYWIWHNHAGPSGEVLQETDGTFFYTTEIYSGGDAEVRFTEVADQHHNYELEITYKIWNEFFVHMARQASSSDCMGADFDGNGTVDLADLSRFTVCATGPAITGPPAGCPEADFAFADADQDGDVDQADFGMLQTCLGANVQVVGVSVSPAYPGLIAGQSVTLTASVTGATENTAVSWYVREGGGGALTPAGPDAVTYESPGTSGVFHVCAVSHADPRRHACAEVTVVTVTAEELARYNDAATWSASLEGDALLIAKNGVIVFENYVGIMTSDTAHMLASGTKSFNAALFALGQDEGLWTVDENVSQTITEWLGDPNKSQITIRHLLSLSSGLVDSPEYSATNVRNLDTYSLAINDSLTPYPPGAACIYAPSNFQVLAAMFERKTGGTDPVQYLYDRLLSKLGFDASGLSGWTRDRLGKPQMGGGAYFTAREWANYGKLWLQTGSWNGQQLLDTSTVLLAHTYDNPTFKGYGLTWWLNLPTDGSYEPGIDQIPTDGRGDGNQIASNAPQDTYMAAGTGKQRLYVIPSASLVIVRFGNTIGNPSWSDHTMLGKILGTP